MVLGHDDIRRGCRDCCHPRFETPGRKPGEPLVASVSRCRAKATQVFERDALLADAGSWFRVLAVHNAAVSRGTRIASPPALGPVVMAHCSGLGTLLILPLSLGALIVPAMSVRSSAQDSVPTPP